ncbi:DNA polymerase III subunit chi [Thiotrichales bacterium 19S3-7]|nr:DNA polymerase III subunit chi [Thiotrichales bacterium 19S3-7]MCF6801767.1 DNA polymerase III subunit chi [Thiotrichales bacterium 19S3-11]
MQVDFYILSTNTEDERLLFCCRLIEKVLKSQQRLIVLCKNYQMLEELDQLLWSYKDSSFIAHLPIDELTEKTASVPVILTTDEVEINTDCNIIVKLQNSELSSLWPLNDTFRVLEIVDQDQTVLESSRNNFKDYKKRGFKVGIHKL